MFEELTGLTGRVFFRDDDADSDLPQLRTLLDTFARRETPLNLAVIPGTLTPSGARLLREAHSRQPLSLHQHGWMHVNHEPAGRKCEFGVSRGLEAQRADIANGRERLAELLPDLTVPIFTPPWNRCTRDTHAALASLGFRAVSTLRSAAPTARLPLSDVSVTVDLFRWREGPVLRTESELTRLILAADQPCGILLHHKVMGPEAFRVVEALLDALGGSVHFHRMEDLCQSAN